MLSARTDLLSRREFIALIALMTSLIALAIDAMLPALPQMGEEFAVAAVNDRQLIISYLFFGTAIGTFIYGPWSDSMGRKTPVYVGVLLFCAGTLVCLFAENYNMLLAGRVLQGIGVAGPRIVSIAIVRDLYSGREMAKIMSMVMVVFIMVPALAPMLGQFILLLGSWRLIFIVLLILALLILLWFGVRQVETLAPENRQAFSMLALKNSVMTVLRNPVALGYTLASTMIFGAFIGYLSSAQQILQELYQLGDNFPYYFAVIALFIGASSFVNAQLVIQHGMRTLSSLALAGMCVCSMVFLLVAFYYDGVPALHYFLLYIAVTFFCVGILFGNFNAMALEPDELGKIAGVAAAVVGSISTLFAIPLGAIIGGYYNESVIPLVLGFTVLGLMAALIMHQTEKRRL